MSKDSKDSVINDLPTDSLHRFSKHTFRIPCDEVFQGLIDSVELNGVIEPVIVRSRDEGGYEIIAGHRRHRACEIVGCDVPAIVREMDDDTAIIFMVDSNKYREKWLSSEKAHSYKAMIDALNRRGERFDLTFVQSEQKVDDESVPVNSRSELAKRLGTSESDIQRHLRLCELIPELLEKVDVGELKLIPAVHISFLDKEIEQYDLLEVLDTHTPSVREAKLLKEVSQSEGLTPEKMREIVRGEDRAHEHYTFPSGGINKYVPKDYSRGQIHKLIVKLLKQHWEKARRDSER